MAEGKRFRTSLFGFNKSDVSNYMEKVIKEFNDKLREKQDEIVRLTQENTDLQDKHNSLVERVNQIENGRSKIAEVLISAQENAEKIIQDAQINAMEEKEEIIRQVEEEKEKLVDAKQDIKMLRKEVTAVLQKFEAQLNGIVEEYNTESDFANSTLAEGM